MTRKVCTGVCAACAIHCVIPCVLHRPLVLARPSPAGCFSTVACIQILRPSDASEDLGSRGARGAGACPCLLPGLAWLGLVWAGPCGMVPVFSRPVTSTRNRSVLPAQEADDGSSAVALVEKMVGAPDPPVDVILMDYIMVRRALHTCSPLQYDPATKPHTRTPAHINIPTTNSLPHTRTPPRRPRGPQPVMEGPDATKAIRALGFKGHIFGCTGNAVMSDQEHFVKCGAKYVPRPPR